MDKPYHLLTRAEQTAARIAHNRAVSERIAEAKSQRPPARSTGDSLRLTPEDRAKLAGSVIRKVRS